MCAGFRRTRRFRAAGQPLSRGFLSFMIGGVGEGGIAALPPGLRRFGRSFRHGVALTGIEHQKLARIGPQHDLGRVAFLALLVGPFAGFELALERARQLTLQVCTPA